MAISSEVAFAFLYLKRGSVFRLLDCFDLFRQPLADYFQSIDILNGQVGHSGQDNPMRYVVAYPLVGFISYS